MKVWTALLLASLIGGAHGAVPSRSVPAVTGPATSAPTMLVTFEQPASVHVNARAPSTVTVTSGQYSQVVALTGEPDPLDPEKNYRRLDDAAVIVTLKPGSTVSLLIRLYVCDGTVGICRVEEHRQAQRLRPGLNRIVVKVGTPTPARPTYLSPRT
ncbi:hypothetical protein [Deinococcus sp.]|uniref:hypothetical protein n=1 Tax=Deinococcus sp. TaxID=47478 RepID=UPI0028699967|nr:hypothetical protein [Deinococcus sp.]